MRSYKQLDFFLRFFSQPAPPKSANPTAPPPAGHDSKLGARARELLSAVGASALLPALRVEWNSRMRTAAGRAEYQRKTVSLNPRLHEHGEAEIDRTLRHELAHLVAHLRAGRRRISPHGAEWRQACCDLGIGDERRCHTLPFPTRTRARCLLYRCPKCHADFPRVRRIRRAVACLACCRRYNRGAYDKQFQLRLVSSATRV